MRPLKASLLVIADSYLCRRVFIYDDRPSASWVRMANGSRIAEIGRAFSEALGLPRTAARIIEALARTRDRLRVDEIVRRVRRSERSVRENLTLLVRRGILERQIFVTANKKLAYVYSLKPVEDLVAAARGDLARALKRIERLARQLRQTTA